jgi:Zn-dependent protease
MNLIFTLLSRGWPLGRVAGIPVTVNWTWAPAALFLTFSISGNLGLGALGLPVALGATLLLFGSILAHEIGHAVMAKSFGIRTRDITLHLLGGVAHIEGEPRTPKQEFAVAAAGPVVSFALAGVFFAAQGLVSIVSAGGLVSVLCGWLALANAFLACFNLIPGLPLDGGRILRAWLWQRSSDREGSSWKAARAGEMFGVTLFALGLTSMLFGGPFGFMTLLVSWFIMSAARAEKRRVEALRSPFQSFAERLRAGAWSVPFAAFHRAWQESRPNRSARPSAPQPRAAPRDPNVIDVDYVVHKDR